MSTESYVTSWQRIDELADQLKLRAKLGRELISVAVHSERNINGLVEKQYKLVWEINPVVPRPENGVEL